MIGELCKSTLHGWYLRYIDENKRMTTFKVHPTSQDKLKDSDDGNYVHFKIVRPLTSNIGGEMSSIQYAEIIRSENENLNIIDNSKQEPLKTEISECVCFSEVKNTHNICMDCILKTSNIGKDRVYTEQQVREAILRANPELMVEKCNEIINIINDN